MKKCLIILISFAACGGVDDVFSDPPSVSGDYSCTNDCSGNCDFDADLSVVQDSENIILRSDFLSDAEGTVDNDGDFNVASDSCTCDGQFIDDTFIVHCLCNDVQCQSVTYTRG